VITSVIRLVTLFPFLQAYDKTYQIAWTDLWMYVVPSSLTLYPRPTNKNVHV
jgi:hypothetical protein